MTRAAHTPITQPEEQEGYVDPAFAGAVEAGGPNLRSIATVESIVASLIEQDLLHGSITYKPLRSAITDSKTASALSIGFPRIWDVIKSKAYDKMPGWVKEPKSNGLDAPQGLRADPGMIVNLGNARPAGALPAWEPEPREINTW